MKTATSDLKALLETVAKKLVGVHFVGSSASVSVPVLYPSGASAVINVSQHSDRYFVSDLGYGLYEAEMIGAAGSYQAAAKKLANHYGVVFDNQCFFISEATDDQLASVITLIANCSVEAANAAALKASERSLSSEFEAFYRDLSIVFGSDHVTRDAEVLGSSSRKWTVSSKVESGSKVILFETVTRNYNSVANAALKFHDISRIEVPPRRISVVQDFNEMGSYVNLLAQSSDVIEAGKSKQALRSMAA